jgi:hypothetical protein
LLTRDQADERYGAKPPLPVGDGFFDPLNGMDTEVDLPADEFTVVQSQSIEVHGPGHVVVIGLRSSPRGSPPSVAART